MRNEAMNSISPEDRFWSRVAIIPFHPCWEWIGGKAKNGYGVFYSGERPGMSVKAHRFSWRLNFGSLPNELDVCHKCDNPGCVRPDHLFLGTHSDNMHDMASKGRTRLKCRDACKHGHPFSPENTSHGIRGAYRIRWCKTCARLRSNARYHDRRAKGLPRDGEKKVRKRQKRTLIQRSIK